MFPNNNIFNQNSHNNLALLRTLWLVGELFSLGALAAVDKWNQIPTMPNLYGSSQCYPIPPNMTLCQNVGYNQMILPNFLQHEDVKEAIHQSNIWVALVNTNCHPDLKRFLCSLYAPVCLKGHQEEKIRPCFQLCDDVKKSCLPRMMFFGFKWPPMVECDQFPRQSNMCIPLTGKPSNHCPSCDQTATYESIVSSFCLSNIVMKTKIRQVIRQPNGKGLRLRLAKKSRYFKKDILSSKEKAAGSPEVQIPCSCGPLSGSSSKAGRWLLMANRSTTGDSSGLQATFLVRWDKRNPNFRSASRAMRMKKDLCKPQGLELNDMITSPRTLTQLQRDNGETKTTRPKKRGRKKKNRKNKKDRKKRRRQKNKKGKRKGRRKGGKGEGKKRRGKKRGGNKERKRALTPEQRRRRRERRKRRKKQERQKNRKNKTTTPTNRSFPFVLF